MDFESYRKSPLKSKLLYLDTEVFKRTENQEDKLEYLLSLPPDRQKSYSKFDWSPVVIHLVNSGILNQLPIALQTYFLLQTSKSQNQRVISILPTSNLIHLYKTELDEGLIMASPNLRIFDELYFRAIEGEITSGEILVLLRPHEDCAEWVPNDNIMRLVSRYIQKTDKPVQVLFVYKTRLLNYMKDYRKQYCFNFEDEYEYEDHLSYENDTPFSEIFDDVRHDICLKMALEMLSSRHMDIEDAVIREMESLVNHCERFFNY